MGTSLAEVKASESKLTAFASFIETLEVKTQEEYKAACVRIVDAKNEVKKIGFVLDPGIASAKEHLDFLRNQKSQFTDRWTQHILAGTLKTQSWAEEEKRAAKVEADRVNAELARQAQEKADADRRESERIATENRKAQEAEIERQRKSGELKKREADRLAKEAREREEEERKRAAVAAEQAKAAPPPRVEVKANIPAVAGVKNQTYWTATVKNEDALIDAFHDATGERRAFLRKFVMVNQMEVGAHARKTKNNTQTEADIPGCEASSRG